MKAISATRIIGATALIVILSVAWKSGKMTFKSAGEQGLDTLSKVASERITNRRNLGYKEDGKKTNSDRDKHSEGKVLSKQEQHDAKNAMALDHKGGWELDAQVKTAEDKLHSSIEDYGRATMEENSKEADETKDGENEDVSAEFDSVIVGEEESGIVTLPVNLGSSGEKLTITRRKRQKTSKSCTSSRECQKLDYLCVPHDGKSTKSSYLQCRKGTEFSEECKSSHQCFSQACHPGTKKCGCPTPEACIGCSHKNDAPCLRVENISPNAVDICSLAVKKTHPRKASKTSNIYLFDVGGAHSTTYDNLNRLIDPSTHSEKCFSIIPFQTLSSQQKLLPPGFVQASLNTKDQIDNVLGQVTLNGLRESIKDLLGLQIFINGDWITHIDETDVALPPLTGTAKAPKQNDLVEIVKYFYPRIHINWEDLKTTLTDETMRGKTFVVDVLGAETLDFDIPRGMGIEFVGNGINSTELSIHGSRNVHGRASFNGMSVSFENGSLFLDGPTFFNSSRLVDINRCPDSFIEFNGLCFLVSTFLEQADDAADFCSRYDRASLATYDDAAAFVGGKEGTLNAKAKAWIQSINSECSAIDSGGSVYESDEQEDRCEEYINVLCSAQLNKPLYGKAYTSYFSDQIVGTYKQDFYKRIVDKDRLPFQLGGTVTFAQIDLDDGSGANNSIGTIFTVPDSRPVAVAVNVTLESGSVHELEYAIDTHNQTGADGHFWPIDDASISLPTKLQLHSNADVCIKKIDLMIHNETGHTFKVVTIPASLFKSCIDYNVCGASDELSCGRSLMYYDEVNSCAKLSVGSSVIPQDLSIDLFGLQCSRLTTWTHNELGSPFLFEATVSNVDDKIEVKEYLGDSHQYTFSDITKKVLLEESTVLPTDFEITGEGVLEVLKITRYGKNISIVDFSKLWDCINMCQALGHQSGLVLAPSNATSVQLSLVDAVECRKLVLVLTDSGDRDGRDACTSPPFSIDSAIDVLMMLKSIESPDQPFRTVTLNVSESLFGNDIITVPTNRGLIMYQDLEIYREDILSIEGPSFNVESFGELHFDDLIIKGSSTITTALDAELNIVGCEIDIDELTQPFLTNAGNTNIGSTSLLGSALLKNTENGRIDHMYVGYYNMSTVINSNHSTIQFSRMTFYEEFTMNEEVDWVNFREEFKGNLELPDAKRFYETLDDEDDKRCDGSDLPDKTIEKLDSNQCIQACEDAFICSGVITYFKDDDPMCGLCLREDQCKFDCSSFSGGAYYVAGSGFDYSKVKACPYISRPFKMVQGTTLEKCKLFCSYYRPCEGFRVTVENSCELIADLDFAESCPSEDEEFAYIPYVKTTKNDFVKVHGSLLGSLPIANHKELSLSECASVCIKTVSCLSFEVFAETCILYNKRDYEHSAEDTGLHLLVDDVFPKKRYMIYASCFLADSYDSFNMKSVERCRDQCNEDYSCGGFTFRPLVSLFEDNCELYNSTSLVNRVFGPDTGCLEQPTRRVPREHHLHDRLLLDVQSIDAEEFTVSSDGMLVDEQTIRTKSSKSAKTSNPSQSNQPSARPSNIPSLTPSVGPSVSPSMDPSFNPTLSTLPSGEPSNFPTVTSAPSPNPSVSKIPSSNPSVSIRPSQVTENYDLYVAFVQEVYLESEDRAFKALHDYTEVDEEECKTLCFYDKDCIAIQFDKNSGTCQIGELQDFTVSSYGLLADMQRRTKSSKSTKKSNHLSNHPSNQPSASPSNMPSLTPSVGPSDSPSSMDDKKYLVLASKQVDDESRYLSTNVCFVGEQLEDIEILAEETFGYFGMPRTCTKVNPTTTSSTIQSPAECGLECRKKESCLGFLYFVDYGGMNNTDKIGTCDFVTSSFDLGTCDGVDNNSDLYLRADVGAACQASCDIHFLCSSFVFDQDRCDLYSDIALLNDCEVGHDPQQVQIGLSYRSRDGLVAAPGQCLIEYEDLREIGCFDFASFQGDEISTDPSMTPFSCQQTCKNLLTETYAVKEGGTCICGSTEYTDFPVALNKTESCNVSCVGDPSQPCGGSSFASVGYTGLPLIGLTLPQCKKECFQSYLCEAIIFDKSSNGSTTCELRSRGEFETCNSMNKLPYIESLEHYYTSPRSSFIGTDSILKTTTELKEDCHKLCDSYSACEAIKYDIVATIGNCELLGGDIVRLVENEIVEGVEVANNVTLYTQGYSAEGMALISTVSTTFDLDECRTLCDQHVNCGSLTFLTPTCNLYKKNDFVKVPQSNDTIARPPHFIAYSYFVDPSQEFHLASGLCVDDVDDFLMKRKTTQSEHDCSNHCNSDTDCAIFSYSNTAQTCILYSDKQALTKNVCDSDFTTYVMFTRGKFAPMPDSCLKDEENLQERIKFTRKNPLECMALCDKWFNCRSFRSDEMTGDCTLYEREQFSSKDCPGSLSGLLFVYNSDYYFTRLDQNFCVGTNALTSIEDTPIEACKSICEKYNGCISFEHTQNGLCVLYSSADFSNCAIENGKDLYISYREVVAPDSRYFFNELSSCFDTSNNITALQDAADENRCKQDCEEDDDCLGIQIQSDKCYFIGVKNFEGEFLDSNSCDTAFLKTKLNPYKKTDKTCLQNRIEFNGTTILNKEDYECMSLCNFHPYCRYFIHNSDDPSGSNPELRECILFEAQGREVDACDGEYKEYNDTYNGLTAYVNGRTFVDQITWFGEPETVFAEMSGISYQECASICDSVPQCNAFTHTWNYRLNPLSSRSLLFTSTRIASLDFDPSNNQALYLAFDAAEKRLVLQSANSDDDVRAQLFSPELTSDSTLKLKFWTSSGKCLSKGPEYEQFDSGYPSDTHTLDAIQSRFKGQAPSCLTLDIKDCSDESVLEFDNFLDRKFNESIDFSWKSSDTNGCIRLRNIFDRDIISIGNGNMSIPLKLLNRTITRSNSTCIEMFSSSPSMRPSDKPSIDSPRPSNSPFENTSDQRPSSYPSDRPSDEPSSFPSPHPSHAPSTTSRPSNSACRDKEFTERICEQFPNQTTFEDGYETTLTSKECKITEKETLDDRYVFTTFYNYTESLYIQKTTRDLLEEMYNFFDDKCPSNATGSNGIFSSSFGGIGCDFDDSAASFPSQEFSFASDAVILQNDGSSQCLASDLKLGSCADTTEWIYLFNSGHLYFISDDYGKMKCLSSHSSSPGVIIEDCDRNDEDQMWIYDPDEGTIFIASNETLCLLQSDSQTVAVGSCDEKSARWSRYEECRLNTRTTTKAMKLESIKDSGKCLGIDGASKRATLDSCTTVEDEWVYNYNGNNATLIKSDDTTQCLGRRHVDGDYETEDDMPKDFPTGLVPCKEIVWSRQALKGEEHNIFSWSLINFRNGEIIGQEYCLQAPTEDQQTLCSDDVGTDATSTQTWRALETAGDRTEISVKPSATLQIITDPEVLFEFYLFSKEGKSSRILRSRMAGLVRDVERLRRFIQTVLIIVKEAYSRVQSVQDPIGKVTGRLTKGADTFSLYKKLIYPFEFVPYVGKAIKAARIRIICTQVSGHMKKGKTVVKKVDVKVQTLNVPIEQFESILERVNDALPLVYAVDKFVDLITRSSFCALREKKQNHYDFTQDIINVLIVKVSFSTTLVGGMKNPLSIMNKFKSELTKYVLKPIKFFDGLLDPLYAVMNALSFLEVIAKFTIPIPLPSFKWGKKCAGGFFSWVCIPWPKVSYRTIDFGLILVGEIVKKIVDAIKSIPIVGSVITFVEKAVDSALAAIFKTVGVELPSFRLDIPFIDELKRRVEETLAKGEELIDYFKTFLDLGEKFTDLLEPITEPIFDALPSIDLGCGDKLEPKELLKCSFKALGMNLDLDSLGVPKIDFAGIDLLPDTGLIEIMDDFVADGKEIVEKVTEVFSVGVECREYTTVPIDIISEIETRFNISTADIPIPKCPINVQMCTDLRIPHADEFGRFIRSKLGTIARKRNRNLASRNLESRQLDSAFCSATWPFGVDVTEQPWNFWISFALPLQKLITIPIINDSLLQQFKTPKQTLNLGGMSFTLGGDLTSLSTVNFLMGCKGGEFQLKLSTNPAMKLDLTLRTGQVEFSQSEGGRKISKGPGKFISNGPNTKFAPTDYAMKALKYLKGESPDLEKFQYEMEQMSILNKILCHLDFIYVNLKIGLLTWPVKNDAKLRRWLKVYKQEIEEKIYNARDDIPKKTIKQIISDLGGESTLKNRVREWRMAEKKLAKAQKYANELREWQKRLSSHNTGTYSSVKKFYDAFPHDEFGRQKTCKVLYGYTVGVPNSFKDNSLEFAEAVAQSLSFSPFTFAPISFLFNVGTFGQRRTIDFNIADNVVDRFDMETFIMGRSVAALGLIKKFIELSNAVEKAKESRPRIQSDIDKAENDLKSGAINVVFTLLPVIPFKPFYDGVKEFLIGDPPPSANTNNKNSVFDLLLANEFIGKNNRLAEQKVMGVNLISAFPMSLNLMRSEGNDGWTGVNSYCKGIFCIYPIARSSTAIPVD